MRIEFSRSLAGALLAFAIVSSVILVAMLAYSGGCISHPHGTIIEVAPGENFLLRYRLYYDEPGYDGMFLVTLVWYNYENKPDENLTFLSARAYWDTGDNLQMDVALDSTPSGANTMWMLGLDSSSYPSPYDNNFTVDIWMRASGVGDVPHAPRDNHPILGPGGLAAVSIAESSIKDIPGTEKPITIRVRPLPIRGVDVSVSSIYQSGLPGAIINYIVTVKNTGTLGPDNYNLSKGDNAGWGDNVWLDNYRLENIPQGENRTTTLRVRIPENATGCTEDNIWVKATSQGDNTKSDNDSCIAHATIVRGVQVVISPPSQENDNGGTLKYDVLVKNLGNVLENFLLDKGDNAGWTPSLDNSWLLVPKGENRATKLTVNIPSSAVGCTWDNIWVKATSKDNENVWDNESCLAHVRIVRGVLVVIQPSPPDYLENENGGTLTYTVTVINTGNVQENFQLEKGDNAGWTLALENNWLMVQKGENRTTKLIVNIPANATGCTWDNIWVKAASKENAGVFDNKGCLAHVRIVRGVQVVITPPSQENDNGGTLKYDVLVKNLGNVLENFLLDKGDNAGWTLALENNWLLVPKDENRVTKLIVNIPANATGCTWDNIWVQAASKDNTAVFDNESCLAHVKVAAVVRGVQVVITPSSQENDNGGTLTYIVTVLNLGNVPENFQLANGDNAGWTLALENNWLLTPRGENRTTKLIVNIPANATGCTWDNIWVKATSKENAVVFDNKSCLAHVRVVRGVDVSISPSYQSGLNGETLDYTITVSNTGNVEDTYSLTAADNAGWAPTVFPGLLTVPPWENRMATLSVTVPPNAIGCTNDNITATATGTGVSDSDSCIAHATIVRGVNVSVSPSYQSGARGIALSYTVTITNTGNVVDNYDLTVSDNENWGPTLDNNRFENVAPGEDKVTILRVTIPENAVLCTQDNISVTAAGTGVTDSDSCIAHAIEKVVGWDALIAATFSGGSDDAIFGVRPDATSGFDNAYDIPEPPAPPKPYVRAYFYYPGQAPDELHHSCLPPENLMEWPLRIEYADDIENVTLTWNIENVPTEYNVLLYRGGDLLADMRVKDNYTFEASTGTYDFRIVVGAIVRGVQVVISPPSQENENGGTLTYIVTVLNLGNVQENFQLTKGDNAGWTLTLVENLRVPKGENRQTTLTVMIPGNATGCTWDNIWVKATSENTAYWDNKSCLAHVKIVRGVSVSISPPSQENENGGMLTYTVTVKNLGNVLENFQLITGDNAGWTPSLDNSWLPVSKGENRTTKLIVNIPANATGCTWDNIWVKATSKDNENVWDNESCLAHVKIVRGVRVVIQPSPPDYLENENGRPVTFTVTVVNLGNVPENFQLASGDNAGWTPTLENIWLLVPKGENKTTRLTVAIPANATGCTWDNIWVKAASKENAGVFDNKSCLAHVKVVEVVRGVQVVIEPSYRSGVRGSALSYTVTITNTGNVMDNYDLTVIDNENWGPTLDNNRFENVSPGEKKTTILRVTIPENAMSCTKDNITVTATGTGVSANASCIAHATVVIGVPKVSIYASPSYKRGKPGTTLTYKIIVWNRGNVVDNYTLSVSDNAGWGPTLSSYLLENVKPGRVRVVTLSVRVPEGATYCTRDNITVTVTSQADPSVSSSASCIAHAFVPLRKVSIQIFPSYKRGKPGTTLTYMLIVWNRGNVVDNYTLSVSDNAGWGPTLSSYLLENVKPSSVKVVILSVHVPEGATYCTRDNIMVTVTSLTDNNVTDSKTCIAHRR